MQPSLPARLNSPHPLCDQLLSGGNVPYSLKRHQQRGLNRNKWSLQPVRQFPGGLNPVKGWTVLFLFWNGQGYSFSLQFQGSHPFWLISSPQQSKSPGSLSDLGSGSLEQHETRRWDKSLLSGWDHPNKIRGNFAYFVSWYLTYGGPPDIAPP